MESFPRPFSPIRSIHKLRLCIRIGASGIPWLLSLSATWNPCWSRNLKPYVLHDSSLCRVYLRIPSHRSLTVGAGDYLRGCMGPARFAPVIGAHQSVQFPCSSGCSAIAAVVSISVIRIFQQLSACSASVTIEVPP